MSPEQRRALKEEMLQDYARRLEAQLPHGPVTLDEIEAIVEEVGRQQDAVLEERLIREQAPPPTNQATCPECAAVARYKATVSRDLLTIHGRRSVARRYYACPQCGHGFAPLDARLAVGERTATRRLRAWEARLASDVPFAEVPGLLRELRGVEVSASTVERTAVEVGTALRAQALERPAAPPERPGRERLYLGIDGVFCPLREPWRKDGTLGKLICRYGECKVGVLYETHRRDDGLDEGIRWRAYVGTLAKVEGFTEQLVAAARWHGSHHAQELVVLGDGAEWIWHLAAAHFPQAVQIVDYWHMTEHLYHVANARFGAGTAAAHAWVKECQGYLERDRPAAVLNRIAAWAPEGEADQQLRQTEYQYFEKNQERMRYQTFLARGYHIGSGVVESTCRQLVTQRLKEAGMHWREETAEAVVALRAHLKSSERPDLRLYA
jgi:hypothetical protein